MKAEICSAVEIPSWLVVLLNRGRSHKEIAEELFISKKTVDTHVTNILNKVRTTFKQLKLKGRVELLNILEVRSSMAEEK